MRLQLHYDELSFRAISSLDAPENWALAAASTFNHMWRLLSAADDSCLCIDRSHMSIEGQRAQHVFEDYSAAITPPEDVDAAIIAASELLPVALQRFQTAVKGKSDIARDVSDELLQQVTLLVQRVLQCNDPASASNRMQRSRCCVLADVLLRTMNAMTNDDSKLAMAPAVVRQWAEAGQHCLSRWEGEIFSMHDWVCGQRSCVQSRDAEDIVLKTLHDCRAQLAESMLHALKASLPVADEIHFENFFYASLQLGVQAQTRGEADPSRMNYFQLQTFDRSSAAASFARIYTPAHMRDVLRATIFDASGGAATREKLYDWMRANVPIGFCDNLAPEERQEKWLNDLCHDEAYRVTDAALSFMLCRMHVLAFDAATLCPAAGGVCGDGAAVNEFRGESEVAGGPRRQGGVVEGIRRYAGAAGAVVAAGAAAKHRNCLCL